MTPMCRSRTTGERPPGPAELIEEGRVRGYGQYFVALGQLDLESAVWTRAHGRCLESLDMQCARRPRRTPLLYRVEQRFGAATVDCSIRHWPAEERVEVDQALIVLWPDRKPVTEGGHLLEIGHGGPRPGAVHQPPWPTAALDFVDHGQDRRDSDPAPDEQVLACRFKAEVISGPGRVEDVTDAERGVHV